MDTDVPLIHLTHSGCVPVSAGKAVLPNTQSPNLSGLAQPNEQLLMLHAGWQGSLLHVANCWRLLISCTSTVTEARMWQITHWLLELFPGDHFHPHGIG